MSLLCIIFVAAILTSSQQDTSLVNISHPYFENSSMVFSDFDEYYDSSGDSAFTENSGSDDQNPVSDDQGVGPMQVPSISGIIWSLGNPSQSLHEMITVSHVNITFQPGYYIFFTCNTFSSECDNAIRIKGSRCKLNFMNSKWNVVFSSGYQYHISADNINIEKTNVSNVDLATHLKLKLTVQIGSCKVTVRRLGFILLMISV